MKHTVPNTRRADMNVLLAAIVAAADEPREGDDRMAETRRTHLGDILSVTTDVLVSPTLMEGVQNFLSWMTDDDLFTHQLSRAAAECKPYLLEQFPELADVTPPEFGPNADHAVAEWMAEQTARFGEYLDVERLPAGAHTYRDALAEMAEIMNRRER